MSEDTPEVAAEAPKKRRGRQPKPSPLAEDRPDLRPATQRDEIRSADPRTAAAERAAQIRNHLGDLDEGTDEFYIDPRVIPPGWSYEWKRRTLLNAEDPSYQVALAQKGWEPVPSSRHPEMMPQGSRSATVERKGMMLMERPKEITDEVARIEKKKAIAQVRGKEEQLNVPKQGQFERENKGSSLVSVKKGYSPVEIPE